MRNLMDKAEVLIRITDFPLLQLVENKCGVIDPRGNSANEMKSFKSTDDFSPILCVRLVYDIKDSSLPFSESEAMVQSPRPT